jgi:glycosylphosphatidylinositol transamidase (GPIT) subunit GPI8
MRILSFVTLKMMLLLLIGCTRNVVAQKSLTLNCQAETVFSNIWVPSQLDESFNLKIKDTTKKHLQIVFELNFDDSILICLDDSVLYKKKVKSDSKLSMVNEQFEVDYSAYNKTPTIFIFLLKARKYIEVRPELGYRIVFINRLNGEPWELTFSNYPRLYY